MIRMHQLYAAAALGLLLGATACDNDELIRPANFVPIDPLFERYVSLGNSITAGFQAGGIDSLTQTQAYPVLLATKMKSPFFAPLMRKPGCPSQYSNVFTQTRVSAIPCNLRFQPRLPPPYISNTAVPGAEVIDIYSNLDPSGNANALTTFFLGGLTQVQMAARGKPTFASVWIGNNDVLGALTNIANGGDSTLITPTATFQARYTAMLDSLEDIGPRGAVLIGVANVTAIPFVTPGSTYWAIKNGLVPGAPTLPATFTVSANCALISSGIPGARGDSTLVPFPYGGTLLSTAAAGTPTNLDCGDTVAAVVVPAELRRLASAVTAFNTHISSEATGRGFAYLNPNPTLDSLKAIPTQVAPFPSFGAPCSASPFGAAFSCDAVHPSAATHRLIARKLAETINAAYGTAIPTTF